MKKINTLIAALLITYSCIAQKISDTALLQMSDRELGLHFLQKSKNQKSAGYVLAGIAAVSLLALPFVAADEIDRSWEGENVSGAGTYALSIISLVSTGTSIGLISAGNKNAGKAEMLLRTKSASEPPGYEMSMGMEYQKKANRQRMIGYTLLASGFTMMLIAPELNNTDHYESSGSGGNIVAIGGLVATCASIPILISASKNRGRASVLLKKESIPFSYYSRPIGLNSLALSLTLGK
jgi:hypothetical protein